MSVIKLHLEHAEFSALARYAEALGVEPETIVYAATNRLMLACGQSDVNRDIVETRAWRRHHLPARARPRPRDPRASRARGGGGVRRH